MPAGRRAGGRRRPHEVGIQTSTAANWLGSSRAGPESSQNTRRGPGFPPGAEQAGRPLSSNRKEKLSELRYQQLFLDYSETRVTGPTLVPKTGNQTGDEVPMQTPTSTDLRRNQRGVGNLNVDGQVLTEAKGAHSQIRPQGIQPLAGRHRGVASHSWARFSQ